jgi:polysaccharide export outer membrane protein
MQKGKKPDIQLQAGDIVYVPFSYLRNTALGLTGIAAAATSAVIYTK